MLGLSFKQGTDDTRESPSLRIVDSLLTKNASLRLHDPKAMPLLKKALPEKEDRIACCDNPYLAVTGAHAVLVLTDWDEYRRLDWSKMRSAMELPLIVDGRNLLEPAEMRRLGFEYVSIGRPSGGKNFTARPIADAVPRNT